MKPQETTARKAQQGIQQGKSARKTARNKKKKFFLNLCITQNNKDDNQKVTTSK